MNQKEKSINGTDGKEKIPQTLCGIRIHGRENFTLVPLPGEWFIAIEIGKALVPHLSLGSHTIIQHNGYEIGGIGVVDNVLPDAKGNVAINVYVKKRANITFSHHTKEGISMYAWKDIIEEQPTIKEFQSESFQKKIKQLRIISTQMLYIMRYGEYIDEKNIILPPPNFTEETIGSMIDFTCTPFNTFIDVDNIRAYLEHILIEKNISRRLDFAIALHKEYFEWNGITGDKNLTDAPTNGTSELKYDKTKTIEIRKKISENLFDTYQQKLSIPEIQTKPETPTPSDAILEPLDWKTPTEFENRFLAFFDKNIVGQERAKKHILQLLVRLKTGLLNPESPIVGGFFCGPTRVGKTRMVEILAQFLFDDDEGYIHIPCENFTQRHEVATFTGAPPGYIGYGDEPRITQWKLDWPHFKKQMRRKFGDEAKGKIAEIEHLRQSLHVMYKGYAIDQKAFVRIQQKLQKIYQETGYHPGTYCSILLWDEIEKAHPSLLDLQLELLNSGRLILQNGVTVSLMNTIIFWTTNIYGSEIIKETSGMAMGFQTPKSIMDIDTVIWKQTENAIMKYFSVKPEFLARIGKENITVFHVLTAEHKMKILNDIALPKFFRRLYEKHRITLEITPATKDFIIQQTEDDMNRSLGAQAVNRILERVVENKIAHLIEKGGKEGIVDGDTIIVDIQNGETVISHVIKNTHI